MRALWVVLGLAACGGARGSALDDLDDDLAPRAALTREVYTLWWNGARIGDVEEEWRRTGDGVRLTRRERVQVMRGDALATSRLTLEIDAGAASSVSMNGGAALPAGAAVVARAVRVDAWSDDGGASSTAERTDGGAWRIAVDGEPARTADGALVPAELVPRLVALDGGFDGGVLLPGRGFAEAHLRVADDGDAYRAELEVPGGRLVTRLSIDRDGTVLRAAGADGVVAVLATPADVALPFDPPEVVDRTGIAVTGTIGDDARRAFLAMAPVERPLPPALPGQQVAADGDRWGIVLDPGLPGALAPGAGTGARDDEIAELVHVVDTRLTEDLGATATTLTAARRATRGDCTTHALLFAALAGDAGIDVRLVTGLRLAEGRLIRHRWAVAWTGARWVAVDPTHGEAPARGWLLGLAVHGARADEVALADEVAYAGTGGARAKVQKVEVE